MMVVPPHHVLVSGLSRGLGQIIHVLILGRGLQIESFVFLPFLLRNVIFINFIEYRLLFLLFLGGTKEIFNLQVNFVWQ